MNTPRPAQCYCNRNEEHHKKGCHPARPLCRWMRKRSKKYTACNCDAYHYPHRPGSRACRAGVPDAILKSPSYQRAVGE